MRSLFRPLGWAALAAVVLAGLAVGRSPEAAIAHTPHDAIGALAVSPDFANDQTLYVKAESRLLKSTDGGDSWFELLNGTPLETRDVAISGAEIERLYVTSDEGIFRSDDAGGAWTKVSSVEDDGDPWQVEASAVDPEVVLVLDLAGGVRVSDDAGVTWRSPSIGGISAIAASKASASAPVFVVGAREGAIRVSNDDGTSWSDPVAVLDGAVTAAHVAGENASLVYVGGENGDLFRSDDGGASFAAVGEGLPEESIRSIAVRVDDQNEHVWVSTYTTGVYFSDDGGATWTPRQSGLSTDVQADDIGTSQFGQLGLGLGATGTDSDVLFLGGFDGLFRSSDGGLSWATAEILADYFTGLAVSPAFGDDRRVAAAGYVKGALLSSNAGDDWTFSTAGLERDLSAGNELIPVLRLHNIFFSPDFANDDIMFSASWTRVLRSLDGGETWEANFVSEPPPDTILRLFVLDVSPQFADDKTLYVGTRQGEIFRSTAQGEDGSFELMSRVNGSVRDVALSPAFADDTTLFVSTDQGVFRSEDSGVTWDELEPTGNSLLAISPGFADDGVVFAGTGNGLVVSRDGGDSWEPVGNPDVASGGIEGVGVSPAFSSDGVVLTSVRSAGLYRSEDGGETFAAVAPELLENNTLIADFFTNPSGSPIHFSPEFAQDQTVFAYAGQRILRSNDAGDSWQVLDTPGWAEFPFPDGSVPGETVVSAPGSSDTPSATSSDGIGLWAAVVALAGVGVVGAALLVRRRRAAAKVD